MTLRPLLIGACLLLAVCATRAEPVPPLVPVEAFARAGQFSMPRLSPDGRHLALVTELGNSSYALNVLRLADSVQTSQLLLRRREVPIQVAWVDNERLVIGIGRLYGSIEKPTPTGEIFATDYDGKNQTYVYGPERGTRTPGLTRGYGAIAGLPERPNGHFYMRTYTNSNKRSTLYAVDSRKTTHREIASIKAPDMSFVFRHDGTPAYAYGADEDDNYLLYRSLDGQKWQSMSAAEVGGALAPAGMTADDGKVYAYFSQNGGPASLVLADPAGTARTLLAQADLANVGHLLYWRAPPTRPFGAFIGAGVPSVVYFDPNDPAAQLHAMLSKELPHRRVHFVDQTLDGKQVLLKADGDRDPGAWYMYSVDARRLTRLLAAREGIDPQRMGERRPFQFDTSDGMTLTGFITLPAGVAEPSKLPTVLLPHGGPHAAADDWAFDTHAQFLASRGYLVLQINYRGSGGRGRKFEEAGYLNWGTRIQDDLIEGVRWAIDQGYADPQRICAYGASFGAYSAMMVAAKAQGLLRCAVGYAGLYDLPMMYTKGDIRESRGGRKYLTRVIGQDPAELASNSPTARAAAIKIPVLLIHGEADERTPLAQAKAMRDALENAGNAPDWMAVPNEGHGFLDEDNNIAMFHRVENFLAKHLKAAD